MKKLIREFNTPETYIIISDYPEDSSRGKKNYGIAWYTKELIEPMAKTYGTKFVVFAEKGFDNKPKVYANGNILVLRIFDQKHPSLFPEILKWLWKFDQIKNIHVHSEFCANGGVKNMVLILPFLALIKANRKNITYFSHNVVTTLADIATHLNMKKDSLKYKFFNFGLSYYYRTLSLFVDKFVVMDQAIKVRLQKFVSEKKIFLSPFWTPAPGVDMNKFQAKKKLGIEKDEFLLLYFGFITHYKGADWLIKAVQRARKKDKFKKVRLILAGGEAYSLKDKAYYQKYYHNLLESLKNERNIQITGFVPDNKISTYFHAADLAVYSYRGLIGGSGALMHAIAHKTPFVVSHKMGEILKAKDMKVLLEESDISYNEITFMHAQNSFEQMLKKAMQKKFLQKLKNFSESVSIARSKDTLILACYNELYASIQTLKGKTFALPAVFKRS